jgi:hypothetical protein
MGDSVMSPSKENTLLADFLSSSVFFFVHNAA